MQCQKLAFIHYGKVAGRFVNNYLGHNIFGDPGAPLEQQNYKTLNTSNPHIPISRDWSEEELFEIAIDCSEYQLPNKKQLQIHNSRWSHGYLDRQFVHNHHISWTKNSVQEFNRNGWLTFMFVKDPVELLLSLYFWAKDRVESGIDPNQLLQPTYLLNLSLKDFLREIVLCEENTTKLFRLPDYVSDIQFVAEFSTENFNYFLKRYFNHEYCSNKMNVSWQFKSSNRGLPYYLSSGEVDNSTLDFVAKQPAVLEFRQYLSNILPVKN